MIAICAAMDRELAGLRRRLDSPERDDAGGHFIWRGTIDGHTVLLCRTGLGRRADSAVRALLDHHQPRLIVSAGLAGALDPDYLRGDLVLCESVLDGSDKAGPPEHSERHLLDRAVSEAARSLVPVRVGRSLTVEEVVATVEEKAELRRSTGADIVEMESYWLARLAREKGLAFLAARTVLDAAGDALPDIPGLVRPDGSLSPLRALTRPAALPSLLRLALAERMALANLTRFLAAIVAALERSPVGEPA
jgi:adenosylhomocysteine nucleosidase